MSDILLLKDPSSGASRRIPLTQDSLRIGKHPENDLVLDEFGISRAHCRIDKQNGRYLLRDLESRNGTFLNGQRVQTAVFVSPGDKIQIGQFSLSIESAPQPPESRETPESSAQAKPVASTLPENEGRHVTPVKLKKRVHAILLERMDLKHTDHTKRSGDELRQHAMQVTQSIVQELSAELPAWLSADQLVKEVVEEAVGLGVLEDLLADDEIDEIMVVGWNKVYVERKGKLELTDRQFMDDHQVIAVMRRILAPIGRRIDETSPMADGRLQNGSRVNAVIPPLALSGPTLTIRKFSSTPFTVDDLISFGSMTREMADFLALIVRYRANILISGGTGSGKTTLLNVTSNCIPSSERIITVEDAAELQLQQQHVVRMEARPANIEGRNAISIRDLVRNCLRMRPDRIVVGECRGGEALDMLQAMNTGHDGSLTTLHANSPRDAIARLETLVLMAGMELPAQAIREQISSAVHFIVQVSRFPDGTRKMDRISAVSGMEGDIITLQDIFAYQQEGFDREGRVTGKFVTTGMIPEFVQTLRQRGIDVNLDMFREKTV